MKGKLVTVFGGSGFLGRYLVQALAKEGARVRIAVRHPDKAEILKPLGNVGEIMPVYANTLDPLTVGAACVDADYVINLTGILFEGATQTFENIHIRGASNIAEAAKRHGAKRLIHISAIGSDPRAESKYSMTKGKGEQAVRAHYEEATIIRPNVVFGEEDKFINRFAEMARISPFLPAFGGGKSKLQPVYVNDVAQAIVACLKDESTAGKTYELNGPRVYSMREIFEFILKTTERKKLILYIPYWLAYGIANIMQLIRPSELTVDQVTLSKDDAIASPKALSLKDLGLIPESLEAMAPGYLARYKPNI